MNMSNESPMPRDLSINKDNSAISQSEILQISDPRVMHSHARDLLKRYE